ncbi:hypothetical protein EVAR_18319_1 [Eumeta japonica]|uniref:Uncharacterized protein n=1 Tax=Eumeta variegata TaxID=151549 RepID=A0A4C1VB56_EUMVA|nr:hypothetical protein EVAR_18319_1 [Eumeta japonica]
MIVKSKKRLAPFLIEYVKTSAPAVVTTSGAEKSVTAPTRTGPLWTITRSLRYDCICSLVTSVFLPTPYRRGRDNYETGASQRYCASAALDCWKSVGETGPTLVWATPGTHIAHGLENGTPSVSRLQRTRRPAPAHSVARAERINEITPAALSSLLLFYSNGHSWLCNGNGQPSGTADGSEDLILRNEGGFVCIVKFNAVPKIEN